MTTTATVPTAAERTGDFSGMGTPLLNLAAGGVPFPDNRIPAAAIQPIARTVLDLYPLGNVSPSIYRETVVGENDLDQAGGRLDYHRLDERPVLRALFVFGRPQLNPISVRGTDVPGYPTRDDIGTHSAMVSATRILIAVADAHAARLVPALQVLLRPAYRSACRRAPRLRL